MRQWLKNADRIYQQIEDYSDFAGEHCARCKMWKMKKKMECELFAKMAFYKNSKPSQQTLIFHSPPPFHREPPLPATGSEKSLQSFKLWAQ